MDRFGAIYKIFLAAFGFVFLGAAFVAAYNLGHLHGGIEAIRTVCQ